MRLSEPTLLIFHVAARSNVLRQHMGIEVTDWTDDFLLKIKSLPMHRPWLIPHPVRPREFSLDADKFAAKLRACSTSEGHMIRWLLNIWNPGHASTKPTWHFDLFDALNNLDEGNRNAIAWHLQHPVWP